MIRCLKTTWFCPTVPPRGFPEDNDEDNDDDDDEDDDDDDDDEKSTSGLREETHRLIKRRSDVDDLGSAGGVGPRHRADSGKEVFFDGPTHDRQTGVPVSGQRQPWEPRGGENWDPPILVKRRIDHLKYAGGFGKRAGGEMREARDPDAATKSGGLPGGESKQVNKTRLGVSPEVSAIKRVDPFRLLGSVGKRRNAGWAGSERPPGKRLDSLGHLGGIGKRRFVGPPRPQRRMRTDPFGFSGGIGKREGGNQFPRSLCSYPGRIWSPKCFLEARWVLRKRQLRDEDPWEHSGDADPG